MKLEDKHREFAYKCHAKFMNTNATIVFQFINYGGGARRLRTTIRNSLIWAKLYTPIITIAFDFSINIHYNIFQYLRKCMI